MKNYLKGFVWLPVLLVILAALAVFGGAYWYMSQTAAPQFPPYQDQEVPTVPLATIDQGSLVTSSPTPTITGTISGTSNFRVQVGGSQGLSTAHGGVTVSNGHWSATFDWFGPGTYPVSIFDADSDKLLTSATLTIKTQTAAVSVPGMSKYTDTDFGFSFWYPNSWTVTKSADQKTIQIKPSQATPSYYGVSIEKYHSADMSVTAGGGNCPAGNAQNNCPVQKIYFDPTVHTWMISYPEGDYDGVMGTKVAANVSVNTMGGLHIINGLTRFNDTGVIPLSAENFLVVTSFAGSVTADPLVKTIVATDASVATPVSTAEQIKVIQAEKDVYSSANQDVRIDYFRLSDSSASSKGPVLEWSVSNAAFNQCTIFRHKSIITSALDRPEETYNVASTGTIVVPKGYFYRLICSGSHNGENATASADVNWLQ